MDQFSSNFVKEFILGRSGLGLKMGKFRQIIPELWPLIYVQILFPSSILSSYWPIFFKLCKGVHNRNEWFGIKDGLISSNKYRVMALSLL